MSSMDENTLQQFSDIFKHFQVGKQDEDDQVRKTFFFLSFNAYELTCQSIIKEFPVYEKTNEAENPEADSDEEGKESDQPLSKKKMKKIQRLTVAELKQLVKKPESVEVKKEINASLKKTYRLTFSFF